MAAPVPNYSIVPITKDDIPTIGTFLFNSKLQLAINRFLIVDWPNPALQKPHYTKAIEGALSDSQATCLKVVDDATGQAVAHLFYTKKEVTPPGSCVEGESEKEKHKEVPAGFNAEVYLTVMDFVKELEPEFETDAYMDLTHIYVEPSSRKRGIGSWLLQIARDAARDAGLPFTACAEPNFHRFFVNRGLEDTKHVDVDLGKWAAEASGYGVFRVSRMVGRE